MKEKVFPNFWQVVLIIALLTTTNLIVYTITSWMIAEHNFSTFYQTIQVIAIVLNFVPYIVYIINKTNIKLGDYLALPDFNTLIKIIIVSVLVRFVITIPLYHVNVFYNLLLDSKIRLIGSSMYFKAPAIVIGLRWIFIPIAEEILFRGLVLKQFLKQFTPIKAVLLSSLIFSFYHLTLVDFAGHFVVGIILGIFYYKTNSITVSSILHILLTNYILKMENFELTPINLIVYIFIFIISTLFVILLLKRQMILLKSDY
jgi:membrane protease YdiL (CAAX protease family)